MSPNHAKTRLIEEKQVGLWRIGCLMGSKLIRPCDYTLAISDELQLITLVMLLALSRICGVNPRAPSS